MALAAGLLALLAGLPALAADAPRDIEQQARLEFEASFAQSDWSSQIGVSTSGLESQAAAMTGFVCLPTCTVNDGRFLAIASNLITLSPQTLNIQFGAPAGATSLTVGIFDGDSDAGNGNWDVGTGPFEYRVFTDPNRDGSSGVLVAGPIASTAMLNNGWFDLSITTSAAAQAPSGNYFYRLQIQNLNPTLEVLNSFKIRTDGVSTLEVGQQPFGFFAALQSPGDAAIIWPNFPLTTSTTYDGSFSFFIEQAIGTADFVVWGGDLDRGSFDGLDLDTDDPDTPNAPFLPAWAPGTDAVPEKVAIGVAGTTGAPPDDRNPAGNGIYIRRSPSIYFELTTPAGEVFFNNNPSGNQEWEQTRLTTDPGEPANTYDFLATSLPAGVYELTARGVDMQNLNFWRFFHRLLCVDELNQVCVPLRSYLIGDLVWRDDDANSVQDPGEPGISGILMELVRADGTVAETTTTDVDGLYSFAVDAGTYTVRVAASNLTAGGALEGYASTTGGDEILHSVSDATGNVLTYDFGYVANGSIGNYVWYDYNGDGIDNEPAAAGLGGVTVNLTEDGLDNTFGTGDDVVYPAQVTAANGAYDFTQLPPGTYRVDVDESTLPSGLTVLTTANEPLDVVLAADQDFNDADFGYKGINSVGDLVWRDNNGNGIRNIGEPGIAGVTVTITDSGGNLLGTAVTSASGIYLFTGLPFGTFTVTVDPLTLGGSFVPTFDLDGIGTPHVTSVTLTAVGDPPVAVNRRDADFGYQPATGAIGDRVWQDLNGDGVQDGNEPGISGVTVNLLNASSVVIATDVTDATGIYGFTGLGGATYTVQVVSSSLPSGVVPTFDLDGLGTAHTAVVALAAGATNNDVDFGYLGNSSLGDRVWLDLNSDGVQDGNEGGLVGVTVNLRTVGGLLMASTTTGAGGSYGFASLAAGTYVVEVDSTTLPSGLAPTFDLDGTGTAHTASVLLGAAQNRTDVDFGYAGPNSIGDLVWSDTNGNGIRNIGEPGISGVTLSLFDSGGNLLSTAVTSGTGIYLFTGLPFGTFTVTVTTGTLPAGVTPTFDLDGIGTPHTTVVTLTAVGDPPAAVDRRDVDFGYQPANAEIGDRVWSDDDGDGIQDGGEPGLAGVTVNLRDSGGTVIATDVTDAGGIYGFPGLTAGTYSVEIVAGTLPAGVVPTFDYDGTGTPHTASVTLAAGATNNDVDFGYVNPNTGALGDRVWNDLDGDGVQDVGEPGLNGVTVDLLDSGDSVLDTQVTSGDGNYTFTGLAAATYTVEVDTSTLPTGLAQTFDLDGLATPNRASVALAFGQVRNDVDFGYGPCGECDGKATRLRFVYTGDVDGIFVEVVQKKPETTVFSGTLNSGDEFEVIGVDSKGTLSTEIKIYVNGALHASLHTSCSQPIGPGQEVGDFRIVSGASRNGGLMCPIGGGGGPGGGGCGACDGKVKNLTLRYNGTSAATVRVDQKKEGTIFTATLNPGDEFTIVGVDKKDTLGTEIEIFVDGVLHTKIHTSCSKPIGPGLVAGDFEVVSGVSRNGGELCPIEGVPGGGGCGECAGKVSTLRMVYNGSASGALVRVDQKDGTTVFSGTLNPGDEFEFSGTDKKDTLGTEIKIYVNGSLHASVHTSCSQPIGPGQVVGDFEVLSGSSRSGGALCPLDPGTGGGGGGGTGCGACSGKVTELRMRYNGTVDGINVKVVQKNPETTVFNMILNAGEEFQFSGVDGNGTLSTEIKIYVNDVLHAALHTSCSQPIYTGLIVGNFEVVSGASLNGGPLCGSGGQATFGPPDPMAAMAAMAEELGPWHP